MIVLLYSYKKDCQFRKNSTKPPLCAQKQIHKYACCTQKNTFSPKNLSSCKQFFTSFVRLTKTSLFVLFLSPTCLRRKRGSSPTILFLIYPIFCLPQYWLQSLSVQLEHFSASLECSQKRSGYAIMQYSQRRNTAAAMVTRLRA